MPKQHKKYISIAKGISISGVVAGHLGYDAIEVFVNYWHLPIFYFASGYLLKETHLTEPVKFLTSRIRRLLVPFIIAILCAMACHNILLNLGWIRSEAFSINRTITTLIHSVITLSSQEELIGATWFLPSLFIVTLISYTAILILKRLNISILLGGGDSIRHRMDGSIVRVAFALLLVAIINSQYVVFDRLLYA